jgi:replicative DNA helicase
MVEGIIKKALQVGLNEETNRYDFWQSVESRAEYRTEVAAGRIKPNGITTGHKQIDDLLYHKGWGRKELSILMGPAKSGKSMSLIGFAVAASIAGFNVCVVTLEVAARIIADRTDACISGVRMADLASAIAIVKGRVSSSSASAGVLDIYDYPTGSLSPSDLRRLIAKKLAAGVKYDLIVVDYADLMRADVHSSESRENSRQIYVGLRGIAHEFDAAVLSATQTNREGFKATAGKMEHVAEDINKARTVDLLLSLNASEEERANGEARIYFAASRNQKSDITIRVKTEIDKARYVEKILAVET